MKILRKLRRPAKATPPAPAVGFREDFRNGLGRWQPEIGSAFVGAQRYTFNSNYVLGDQEPAQGLTLIAGPDRTSARLISREAPFTPGTRLSYSAVLDPRQEAVWPALWAIGESLDWPACGEVDVMECGLGGTWGVKQTIHTTNSRSFSGDYGWGPPDLREVPEGRPALYGAEWHTAGYIRFTIDGVETGTATYDATEPLRLVMNIALRPGVALDRPWMMTVKGVSVAPI